MIPQNQQPAPTNSTSTVTTTTSTTTITNTFTQTATAKTYNVSITNFSFSPSTLTINKGDTVVWTNNDSVPHQVKGDTLSALSAPVMSNGQTYSFTFNNTGTFGYHCAIHPSMTGTIIVK